MNKVVEMKKDQKQIDALIENVKTGKKAFIPPKKKMKDSIENDAQYLNALGNFIREAQFEMERMMKSDKKYQAFKIQVEIFDAIGKFQSNEGLVNDKSLHYEKVFLPRYEKELKESEEKFAEVYAKSVELSNDKSLKSPELDQIVGFLKKELAEYDSADIKEEEEYKNHIYKILKRLNAKYEEISKENK
jgi:hypothetical protein